MLSSPSSWCSSAGLSEASDPLFHQTEEASTVGFRFRKSFKIAPGVRLNVGRKSSSISFGGKGFHTSISTSGRRTRTVSIPGTGISHVSTSGGKRSSSSHRNTTQHTPSHQQPASPRMLRICSKIMLVIAILALFLAIVAFSTAGAAGLFFLIVALFCLFFWWLWK